MHFMLKEILDQPDVVSRILETQQDKAAEIVRLAKSAEIKNIVLAARGTSDHAGIFGQYLFQVQNRIPAYLATPSVVTLYQSQPEFHNTLVIGISQSGKAQDILEYMSAAKQQGCPVVALTNDVQSSFAEMSDVCISLEAGEEKSVAATKTYLASLTALALISAHLSGEERNVADLEEAPELIGEALKSSACVEEIADQTSRIEECFVVGRGLNYTTALETALKVMETSYIRARAYSSADLMHGPVAAAQAVPCILYVPSDAAYSTVMEVVTRLRDSHTPLTVISSQPQALLEATYAVPMPRPGNPYLEPLVQIVAGQRYAYHLSVAKGLNPDKPRGLSKVTVTV